MKKKKICMFVIIIFAVMIVCSVLLCVSEYNELKKVEISTSCSVKNKNVDFSYAINNKSKYDIIVESGFNDSLETVPTSDGGYAVIEPGESTQINYAIQYKTTDDLNEILNGKYNFKIYRSFSLDHNSAVYVYKSIRLKDYNIMNSER